MGKITQAEYQAAIEAGDAELMNSDDNEDITVSVLSGRKSAPAKGTKTEALETEDLETEEEVTETEEEVEEQDPQEYLYGKDQVQKIVQTRVNTYQKRLQRMMPYKEAVDRICEITGLPFDQLVNRLTGMTEVEQAKILGVPVEQVKAMRQARAEASKERGKVQELSRQMEEMQLKSDKRYADYDLYKDEIDDLLEDNPKLSLKQAYLLVKGDTAVQAAARDAEQAAVARQVKAQKKGLVKPIGGVEASKGPKVNQAIVTAARKIGMDPMEYVKYQTIDNIDAYRAYKNKK